MRIAYIISAYKLPSQLARLVRVLQGTETSVYVHFDRKARAETRTEAIRKLAELPNTCLLSSHSCHWGGFGHVDATIKGLNAIAIRKPDPDWVVLLTGQDYPLRRPDEIARFLEPHAGAAFMEHFRLPNPEWRNSGLDRFRKWHFQPSGRHIAVPGINRGFLPGLVPFGGSSYWCMSRECFRYVHRFINEHPDYVRFFKRVYIPDEMFFQTILMNSPLKSGVINDDLRHLDWSGPSSRSPRVLRKMDLPELLRSPKLFARKFDTTQDAEVLDCIDKALDFTPQEL